MKDESEKEQGFFQEYDGTYSSMRLMSFVALIAAIVFGFITVQVSEGINENGIYVTFGFLISAFAPKAVQKFAEVQKSISEQATARSIKATAGSKEN